MGLIFLPMQIKSRPGPTCPQGEAKMTKVLLPSDKTHANIFVTLHMTAHGAHSANSDYAIPPVLKTFNL